MATIAIIAIIAGASAGAGIGFMVGGKQDTVSNRIEEELYNIMNQNLSSTVNASQNVACTNIQEIVDSTINCTVNFAKQACDASILANIAVSNSFENKVVQEMYRKSTQKASYENSQSAFKQLLDKPGNVSNFAKHINKQITNIQMHLKTDCSQNIVNTNSQRIANVICNGEVNFDEQDIKTEVISECVVNQAGKNEASQALTAISEQEASMVKSGGYMWDIILLMLMFPLMLFLIPLAIRKGFSAFGSKDYDRRPGLIFWMTILLILSLGLWWPGWAAINYGMWPFVPAAHVSEAGQQKCVDGKLEEGLVVNKYMWWDQNCLNASDGGQNPVTCTDTLRAQHYESCGLFADVNGCDDPAFIQDREAYTNYIKVCSRIPDGLVTYCRPTDLANHVFNTKSSAAYGPTCKRCENPSDKWYGMFINSNADCNTANISSKAYAAVGSVMDESGTFSANNCVGDSTGNCYDDIDSLLEAYPHDCAEETYQNRKAVLSELVTICEDINTFSPVKSTTDQPRTLKQQCSVPVESFLDCNSDTSCNYVPSGCVCDTNDNCDCSGVDESIVKSCKNNFEGCSDEQYIEHMNVEYELSAKCQNNQVQRQMMERLGYAGMGFAVFLFLTISLFAFTYLKDHSKGGRTGRNVLEERAVPARK